MGVSNDTYSWFVRNRIVTLEALKDDLVDYLSNTDEVLGDVLWPKGGFFAGVGLAADGSARFKITGLSGIDGTVGGDLLDLTARQPEVESVIFENAIGIDYHVGLRDARIPDTATPNITINPKDGLPNWTFFRHIVGISGVPDAVVDNGNGTITFTVNSITESAVSNAGRTVRVFQLTPAKGAITDAIALESRPVVWDSPNNKITTVAALGQTTISTTPADYVVVLVGPRVLRNTDISTDGSYAYVGTVQGAGGATPPSVFDVSGQRLLFPFTANLWQVLREEDVGGVKRLKIDVKAIAGESGVDQIRVTDSASAIKFKVDEAGNVVIEGDLDVKGTTTTRDVDQVNAYNAYFDNLDAGNADTDQHNIRGEWTHRVGAVIHFAVDGDTGRIGIGGAYDGTAAFKVTGDTLFVGDLLPSGTQDIGASGSYWDHIYATTYHVGASLWPDVTDSLDLGAAGLKWKDLWLSGIGYIGTKIDVAASAIVGDAVSLSLSDIPLRLGTSGAGANEKNWALEVVSNGNEVLTFSTKGDTWGAGAAFFEAKRAADSTAIEEITLTATKFFLAGTVQQLSLATAGALGVATSMMPATKGDLNLGSYDMATEDGYMWNYFAFQTGILAHSAPSLLIFKEGQSADEGCWEFAVDGTKNFLIQPIKDDGTPGTAAFKIARGTAEAMTEILVGTHLRAADVNSFDLGTAGVPWRKLYLSTDVNEGVATSLVPITISLDLGNAGRPWQKLYLGTGGGSGVANNLVPASTSLYLGNVGYPWQKLFLATGAGLGVATSLIPATTAFDLGNVSYPWRDLHASGVAEAGLLRATNATSAGGGAGTITFSAGLASGSGIDASLGPGGGNENSGWLVIRVEDSLAYIPYWYFIT